MFVPSLNVISAGALEYSGKEALRLWDNQCPERRNNIPITMPAVRLRVFVSEKEEER